MAKKLSQQLFTTKLQLLNNGNGLANFTHHDKAVKATIYAENLAGAVSGDTVQLRIHKYFNDNECAAVVANIVKRSDKIFVGKIQGRANKWLFNCLTDNLPQLRTSSTKLKLNEGAMVSAKLVATHKLNQLPQVEILEFLGNTDNADVEIEVALRKFDLPHKFSQQCLAATKQLPNQVLAAELRQRKDLTSLPFVTIDGEDAKDFDDAVYSEECKVDNRRAFRLLVAIADVSHYVKPGSPIDTDAVQRATSVYFPRKVIPMLPEQLSNELCSLKPQVKRLTLVADMRIGASNGQVIDYTFYQATIFSHARLTYNQVAEVIAHPRKKFSATLTNLKPHLLTLYKLFKVLRRQRQKRGALDFDAPETQMLFDAAGNIKEVIPVIRNDAHKLIEEAMLIANTCAADLLEKNRPIGLYRIHDKPKAEKITSLKLYLNSLGVNYRLDESPSSAQLQQIAVDVATRPDKQQIHTTLLRCLQRAVYSPNNIGHYGLGYPTYTHFTSPIRRYPDLLVHRLIKSIISNNQFKLNVPDIVDKQSAIEYWDKLKSTSTQSPLSKNRRQKEQYRNWEIMAAHCSLRERRADEASLDVQAWLKCQFMQQFIGDTFTAFVSSVTSFGLFVCLEKYFIDGLVHISELGQDHFIYDADKQLLHGARSGTSYTIGQSITVRVARSDPDSRQIDFTLVKKQDKKQPKKETNFQDDIQT